MIGLQLTIYWKRC